MPHIDVTYADWRASHGITRPGETPPRLLRYLRCIVKNNNVGRLIGWFVHADAYNDPSKLFIVASKAILIGTIYGDGTVEPYATAEYNT